MNKYEQEAFEKYPVPNKDEYDMKSEMGRMKYASDCLLMSRKRTKYMMEKENKK